MKLRSQRGFTLLEIVIVLSILAVLTAGALSAGIYVWELGKKAEAKTMLLTLRLSLEDYKNQYGTYPPMLATATNEEGDYIIGWGAGEYLWIDVLRMLSGQPNSPDGYIYNATTNNSRRIPFLILSQFLLPPPLAPQQFTDPWGHPYRLIVDGNKDGSVLLPEPFSKRLPLSSASWSLGRKNPLTSWE